MKKYISKLFLTILALLSFGSVVFAYTTTMEYQGGTGFGGLNNNVTPGAILFGNYGLTSLATSSSLKFATSTNTLSVGGALFGGTAPTAGLGTSFSQMVISQNVNNLARQLDLANINMGTSAEGGITFENGNSTNAGASSAYIGGLVMGGPNFAQAGFSGLSPNGMALFNTDGPIAIGAISTNSASSSLTFYAGNGSSFAGGNPDMVLLGGSANLGLGTSSPYKKLSVAGTALADNFIATSSTATSTIAQPGLMIGQANYNTSGYDNLLTLVPTRTYGNSSNAAFKEGVLDIDSTLSGRIALNVIQQSTAGSGSTPEMVNIQNQSTTATGILEKIKTASTQFSGNLGISVEGPVAPAIELNQDVWNGGTNQLGGGLFQISSRDNNFTIDARNDANNGYCRQFDLSPDFSSTTAGTLTLFPCTSAGGSTQLGTGRLNVTGTSTIANLLNLDSSNTSTQGDIMVVKETGNVGISSTTPGSLLSIGTTGGINISPTGTSTFGSSANGINLTNGCFAVGGTCISGGGATFTGAPNSIVTTNASGALIATGTQLTTGSLLATSTTATNWIGGTQLFNGTPPIAGLGTSNSQLVVNTNINNLARAIDIANTNMGANAETGITFENGNSTNAGASSAYIAGVVYGGPNFATAGFGGLAPNGLAIFNTDGRVDIGATSANPASSTVNFYAGNAGGFGGGIPDLTLTGGTANLGLGTTSPGARFGIQGNAGGSIPLLLISSSTSASATSTVLTVDNNGVLTVASQTNLLAKVGIGTTTPPGQLTIAPTTFPIPQNNPVFMIGTSTLASANAAGTMFAMRIPASFVGNLVDFQNPALGAPDVFAIDAQGRISGSRGYSVTEQGFKGTASAGDLNIENQSTVSGTGVDIRSDSVVGQIDLLPDNTQIARVNITGFGIGTTTPMYPLDIASTTKPQLVLQGANTDNGVSLRAIGNSVYLATTSPTTFATSSVSELSMDTNGVLSLGTYANCNGATSALGITAGVVGCDSGVSDARLKKDITPISTGLNTIMALQPVSFYWKDPSNHDTSSTLEQYGFTAQSVLPILPSAVGTTSSVSPLTPNFTYTLDKTAIIAPLVSAVQSQQKEIESLQKSGTPIQKDIEDQWQWIVIGMLVVWNIYLTVYKHKK